MRTGAFLLRASAGYWPVARGLIPVLLVLAGGF